VVPILLLGIMINQMSEEEISKGQALMQQQRIYPLDRPNMFKAALYSILSASQRYDKFNAIYRALVDRGFDIPEKILSNPEAVENIIHSSRFRNKKFEGIVGLARRWDDDVLPDNVIRDSGGDRSYEFALRDSMTSTWPLIGYKCASLFMIKCGYQNVVQIDGDMVDFLHSQGADVRGYNSRGGIPRKQYLSIESMVQDLAASIGLSPALYQFAILSRYGWDPDI
jgi:thermostable 8-oxoguanine DNA glycosylase